jgi:diguanylate cyclase (GGDEF)-like protein
MTRETVDSVIRYGGEEFLMVLPQTDLAGALALARAERIRAAFAKASCQLGDGSVIHATASFGVASVSALHADPPAGFETLIRAGDEELYAFKRSGHNKVRGTMVNAAPALAPLYG